MRLHFVPSPIWALYNVNKLVGRLGGWVGGFLFWFWCSWMGGWMDGCLHWCMHTCMDGWIDGRMGWWIDGLLASLLACVLAGVLACFLVFLFACLLACLLAGLPACLPDSLIQRVGRLNQSTCDHVWHKKQTRMSTIVDSNVLTWHTLSHYNAPTSLACFWEKPLRNFPNLSSQTEAHPWVACWI